MAISEKLISINNNNLMIYDQIKRYLKRKSRNNKDTGVSYERIIRGFFKLIKQKDIEFLTYEDIQITREDIEDYIEGLVESEDFANNTINYNVGVIKNLLENLYNNGLIQDIKYIKNKEIEKLSNDIKPYDPLTEEEVFQMAELALTTEREKKLIKHYLIKTAYDTTYRKEELLKLKWAESFEVYDDKVYIKLIGKRNKIYKRKIAREFYNELLNLKEDGSEYVFNLSTKGIDRMMDRLKKKMKFSPNRNIVFHSIRKAGGTDIYEREGIIAAQKALNHDSIETTQIYIASEDYGVFGGISATMNTDLDLYKNVSYEDLLKATGEMNNTYKILLIRKLKEINKLNN